MHKKCDIDNLMKKKQRQRKVQKVTTLLLLFYFKRRHFINLLFKGRQPKNINVHKILFRREYNIS